MNYVGSRSIGKRKAEFSGMGNQEHAARVQRQNVEIGTISIMQDNGKPFIIFCPLDICQWNHIKFGVVINQSVGSLPCRCKVVFAQDEYLRLPAVVLFKARCSTSRVH